MTYNGFTMENEGPIRSVRPRTSSRVNKEDVSREIDKKRVLIAVLMLGVLLGIGLMWGKVALPRFLAKQEKRMEEQAIKSGEVAGQTDINFGELQNQVDEIKKDVISIKVEDVKEQGAVKKIINDLDELIKKATESARIFDVKGNLCEEAKRRFCE